MSPSYRITKLTKSDKSAFVRLMSKAFERDPLFLYLFGDSEPDRNAESNVTAFCSFMFDKIFLLGEEGWGYFEHESLLGAYIVEKPQTSTLQNIIGGLLLAGRLLPLFFQMSGKRLRLLNSYIRVTRSASPPLPHHYLIMIGVHPEAQGKGIGKSLLIHLLSIVNADNNSQGAALDTENKENLSLYRKFGFNLSSETHIGNVPVYCMFYLKST